MSTTTTTYRVAASPGVSLTGGRLRIEHTTRTTPAYVIEVRHSLDVHRLHLTPTEELANSDIGTAVLATASPLAVDRYRPDRVTGRFVVIDDATVGAGMVGPPRLAEPIAAPVGGT